MKTHSLAVSAEDQKSRYRTGSGPGPHAGIPRGVVDATGQFVCCRGRHAGEAGRYRSRFCNVLTTLK